MPPNNTILGYLYENLFPPLHNMNKTVALFNQLGPRFSMPICECQKERKTKLRSKDGWGAWKTQPTQIEVHLQF
jgi:hypothetical protein